MGLQAAFLSVFIAEDVLLTSWYTENFGNYTVTP